jgi:two-component system, OmpR family, sensor kinase
VIKIGLRTRLALVFSFVFAGILILITGLSYRVLKFRLDENLREELKERAAGLCGYLHFQAGKPVFEYDANDPDEAFFVESNTVYYQIFDRITGELVGQSHDLDLLDLETDPENVRDIHAHKTFSDIDAGTVRLRFHNETIRGPQGRTYLLQIGMRRDTMESALKQFLLMNLFMVPTGLAVAAFAGWWVAGKALHPVREITEAAKKIGISGLEQRLPLAGTGDEIDRLAGTFNDMFARLAKAIGEMKQFTASISHELRTPLTAIRGEAEVMLLEPHTAEEYRRVLSSHLEEHDRLSRLINRLLLLAQAEAGDIAMNPAKLDLAELVRSLIEQLDAVASAKQVTLSAESDSPVWVRVDKDWMETAILNLLDNAIKYTPAGGCILAIAAKDGSECKLEIRDSGIGIAPQDLPHIFERFYRADYSRSSHREGAGLGLSLVQWIIEQHHGHIDVVSEPEKGSRFIVYIPADFLGAPAEPSQS